MPFSQHTSVARFVDGADADDAVRVLAAAGWPVSPPAPGTRRTAVVLDDLSGDEDGPLGVAVVDLPPGRAGSLVGFQGRPPIRPADLAARLLDLSADRLRALGRQRLTASLAPDAADERAALEGVGFVVVRHDGALVHLALDLS